MHKHFSKAFTIVEVMVVVAVVAILATLVTVGYGAVSKNAAETSMKADLNTAIAEIGAYRVENNKFPDSAADLNDGAGFSVSDDNEISYAKFSNGYCMQISSSKLPGITFNVTRDYNDPREGECPEPMATTIQALTRSQCASLTTYTGTNEEAVITLTDNRGGTERTYQVAKLADGNCWMLNNLKLGSTTGSITLTPSDSNVSSNFTLPQLITSGSTDYDNPRVYGPVPGDTGSGATNYGYLYNWSAATAGESRTSHPMTAGNAQNDICPKNWRLPTGDIGGDLSSLDVAFGGTGGYAMNGPSLSSWLNAGSFKGVFSGFMGSENYASQGSIVRLWLSSANPSDDNSTFGASFSSTSVFPGTVGYARYFGFGVRCLLN